MHYTLTDLEAIYAKSADLDTLGNRYPLLWKQVSEEVLTVIGTRSVPAINQFMKELHGNEAQWRRRLDKSQRNNRVMQTAIPECIKVRLAFLALEKFYGAMTQLSDHKRNPIVSKSDTKCMRIIIDYLFFDANGQRKLVSSLMFKLLWPFVTQKGHFLGQIQPRGIYCFFSSRLIRDLTRVIAGRSCIEIAAGDGSLSRFLTQAGSRVIATDNHSWKKSIHYAENVENRDAAAALGHYQPKVVICCWPPPENKFEEHVFRSQSVELYIVINSRHTFASGAWQAYTDQTGFQRTVDARLSAGVLPPQVDPVVLLFKKNQ